MAERGSRHDVHGYSQSVIEFFEPREDAAIAFESTKQALDLVATLVHLAVVFPRLDPCLHWWHHRDETQIQR